MQRLRRRNEFQAARYETAVAALFTLAGFAIDFEDEGDPTTTHVEFTATHLRSDRKYSVEVKSKHRPGIMGFGGGVSHDPNVRGDVRDLLYRSLVKRAHHERIVFIELNLPGGEVKGDEPWWAAEVDAALRDAEGSLTIQGQKAPPAYVFATNDTSCQKLDATDGNSHVFLSGFHIPDFRSGRLMTIREAVEARDRHHDVHSLGETVRAWWYVPSTFNGEIPEREYQGTEAPWSIGHSYSVPTPEGAEATGTLVDAVMMESDLKMFGIYRLDDGRNIVCIHDVDKGEMEIYRRYPDTYFGLVRDLLGHPRTPVEMYDFFYDSYRETPKDKLLRWLESHPNQLALQAMSQEDLAKLYCELLANRMLAQSTGKNS